MDLQDPSNAPYHPWLTQTAKVLRALHTKKQVRLGMTATHVLAIMWSLQLYKCIEDSYTTCRTVEKFIKHAQGLNCAA